MINKITPICINRTNFKNNQETAKSNKKADVSTTQQNYHPLNAIQSRALAPLAFGNYARYNDDPDAGIHKNKMDNLKNFVNEKVGPQEKPKNLEIIEIKKPDVTLADVGGLPENVKKLLNEKMIGLLKHPEVAEQLHLKPKNLILLSGPPGCGKTLIAKALANEHNLGFKQFDATELKDKYVGESEKNIHKLFEEARKKAKDEGKPCLIFLDEFDSIAGKRVEGDSGAAKAYNGMTTQLLTEMDGKDSDNSGLIILAATNAPHMIDPAIKRSGRMETVEIPYPDAKGCKEIFDIHAKKRNLDSEIDRETLAEKMHKNKFSGADVARLLEDSTWVSADRNGISKKMAETSEKITLTPQETLIKQEDIDKAFEQLLKTRENNKKDYLNEANSSKKSYGFLQDQKQLTKED